MIQKIVQRKINYHVINNFETAFFFSQIC